MEFDVRRESHEQSGELSGCGEAEDVPLRFRHRDHHAAIRAAELVGNVVVRKTFLDRLGPVLRPHRGLGRGEDVVGDQGDGEGEERGLGIAERVDLAVQVALEFREEALDLPAVIRR
ncbi:MAG: hypothetical protein QME96_13050 [Myxococcota bacterium]|nr:hypothetical protein [Myxococcota bacterium]